MNDLPTLETALRLAVAALTIFAAYDDLRAMRIRNMAVIAVVVLFVPLLFSMPIKAACAQMIAAAIMLAIGAGLFFAGLFGGGDAKLIAALALWIPVTSLPAFLLIMTIAGGVLALAGLALRRNPRLATWAATMPEGSWPARLAGGSSVIPYGVAIALAALLTLF